MALGLAALGLAAGGCASSLEKLGMRLIFDATPWPAERVLQDVAYWTGDGADPDKHRLDLFLAEGEGWPILIFVHGGGWTEGDKDLTVGGREVYGNIGRYYASQGFGVAVINYRLQPAVGWRDQVRDVARAVAWVRGHIADHGGDPQAIFLSGHSAGAQLAAYVALAPWPLADLGLDGSAVCGVAAVSGAGYDLQDEQTYELGADREFYRRIFGSGDDWRRQASASSFVDGSAPAFLVAYADREWPSLQHQNRLLERRLIEAGASAHLLVIADLGHRRMAVSFSQGDEELARETVHFLRRTPCGQGSVRGAGRAVVTPSGSGSSR